VETHGEQEQRSFKRTVAFSFPALILGVILPQALDGALRTASMVAGAVFFIATVVSFLGVMKAAERDFKER
jgi:hypothetical protein